jgi:hypothetical protein
VLVDAIQAYVGSGPALTDEERRAVRVARLHESYSESRPRESTSDTASHPTLSGAKVRRFYAVKVPLLVQNCSL